ncbi:calcium/proton exchanger [Rhizoclosmatium globosum]|uniref:Vacuolar calcium ion transporter n=1 Tax=Rhizoclosmatium globosum TaxID=329046 RepID=A0A1Y2CWX6_9FUNG|nr:calcium/proton exchanger [Rhizoclosmatium globosum]|eukprot:ORY51541.1 calcium/proton exchanger [Rhizoclosmatium globosum]
MSVDAAAGLPTSESAGVSHHSHKRQEPTVKSSLYNIWRRILWFNVVACIFVPLGIISHFLHWGDVPTFVLNVLAIIPLAKMLDYTTDQLSMRVGETMGGLLNATFGNAVELIVGVLALKDGQLRVVQASIVGSMLSNILLVLGLCFLCGGLFPYRKNGYQKFDADKTNISNGLLAVVTLGFIVPAAFSMSLKETDAQSTLSISRGTAVVLLITYVAFLVYQIKTNPDGSVITPAEHKAGKTAEAILAEREVEVEDDEEEEVPELLTWIGILGLVGATCIIGVCAEFLVDSLDGLSAKAGLSHTFIGIIILPIVGNAAEHVTAVSSAMRNKMDLCIAVAVGSSMQIALMVAPVLVMVGWMMGKELTLDFQLFETAVLFVSIFVVSTLIADGKTNWMEGWMLLASYVIIAVAFFFVKDHGKE